MAFLPESNQNKKKQQKKPSEEELQMQKFTYSMIPQQFLKPSGIFLLKGNIFIDLNPDTQSRISNINYFKHISSSTIHRDLGLLYRIVQTQARSYDSSLTVAQLMRKSDDQDIISFADLLKDHDEIQHKIELIKEQMKIITLCNSQTRVTIDQKRREFEKLRKFKILQMAKNKYYMFFDFVFDYDDMQYKIIGNGMSEGLINLMGCDLDTMQRITMRKGIINFLEGKSKWNLFKVILQQANNMNREQPIQMDVCLRTLDDIVIETAISISYQICESGQAFEGFFHEEYAKYLIDRKTIFYEIHIDDFYLSKINGIREKMLEEEKEEGESSTVNQMFHQSLGQTHNILTQPPHSFVSAQLDINSSNNNNNYSNQVDCQGLDIEDNNVNNQNICDNSQTIQLISPISNNLIDKFINDIPYEVQSQNFIEKFYGLQVIEDQNQNKQPQKPCGFKYI